MPTPPSLSFTGEYALEKMVERAVRNARPNAVGKHPRWVAVRDTFGYGYTTSTQLCQHFGVDPDEEVEGYPEREANDEDERERKQTFTLANGDTISVSLAESGYGVSDFALKVLAISGNLVVKPNSDNTLTLSTEAALAAEAEAKTAAVQARQASRANLPANR